MTGSPAPARFAPAPQPSFRLIPSQFPPIGLFDTVATPADLEAAMELAGWTNDRLVVERLRRLPLDQWVHGRANSSVVMASFLHAAPRGQRFSGPDLGAWYAAGDIRTAAAEVGHHLRREALARRVPAMARTYRCYSATLAGTDYRDIRGEEAIRPELYRPDDYSASQLFGEAVRKAGQAGILYDSVRRRGGGNVVAYRPGQVGAVTQTDHFRISVQPVERRIVVQRLTR